MCGRVIVDTATGSDTGSALQKGQLASMSHARAPPPHTPTPGSTVSLAPAGLLTRSQRGEV